MDGWMDDISVVQRKDVRTRRGGWATRLWLVWIMLIILQDEALGISWSGLEISTADDWIVPRGVGEKEFSLSTRVLVNSLRV